MSTPETPGQTEAGQTEAGQTGAGQTEAEWKRRARLARVFGEVLPESTADDRDTDRAPASSDQWLKDQVPPHHGQ